MGALEHMERDVPIYIASVSALTGFTARQLRYYESIGLLTPARTDGRHRLYSPAEVDRLLALKGLLAQGLTLNGAGAVLSGTVNVPPHVEEKASVPLVDHTAIAETLQQGKSLTSLFPVNDQQSLYRLLERLRKEEGEE